MLAVVATLFFSCPAAQLPLQEDFLALDSRGLDRLAPDSRDRGALAALRGLPGWIAAKDPSAPAALLLGLRWIQQPLSVRLHATSAGVGGRIDVRWDGAERSMEELASLRSALAAAGLRLDEVAEAPGTLRAATPAGLLTVRSSQEGESSVVTLALACDASEPLAPIAVDLPPGVEPGLIVRWDGRALASVLAASASAGSPKEVAMKNVIERLGLAGPRAPRRTFVACSSAEEGLSLYTVEGWAASPAGAGGAAQLSQADLMLLPEDTIWAWVGNARPSALVELVRAFDAEAVDRGLREFKSATQLDLARDLLDPIGPVAGAWASRGSGGGTAGGLVFFARCREPERVLSSLEQGLKSMERAAGQTVVRRQSWAHAGRVCTSFVFPGLPVPVEPSFASVDGILIAAAGRGALKEALDQVGRPRSILDHPRLAKLPGAALEGLIGLSFLDEPVCLERGYSALGMAQASLANMLQDAKAPDLSQILPRFAELAAGARPGLSLTYLRGGDLVSVSSHDRSWVARATASMGSPLGQLQPASLAVVAAVAIPKLMSARLSANEAAAITTLRALSSAQAQVQASGVIDCDGDGSGEYGYFGELSGAQPVRIAARGRPAAGSAGRDEMNPPVLSAAFGAVNAASQVTRSGYLFQIWLPAATVGGATAGVAEDPVPGGKRSSPFPDADNSEVLWCCYAWPIQVGNTGLRCFFINQEGDMLQTANVGPKAYTGPAGAPAFDAAFSKARDMDSPLGIGGMAANDRNKWSLVE
jgi:hypothetical protein